MSLNKEYIKVKGMTCTSCEKRIEKNIKNLPGIINVKCSYKNETVIVEYNLELCSKEIIINTIESLGYIVLAKSYKDFSKYIGIGIIVLAIILLGKFATGFNMDKALINASYFMLFIIGAITSLHCVGMCGGIMMSQTLSSPNKNKSESIKPALLYNIGRIISYTVLGGIVGAVGSIFSVSPKLTAIIQIIASLYMILIGLNMMGFNILRSINIKLPFSTCTKVKGNKSPILIGLLNGFMPCGPLQTMQLYALSTGSAILGAKSMFFFALGTVPLMLTFGILSTLFIKGKNAINLMKFSGMLIIVLGLIMANRGFTVVGLNISEPFSAKENTDITIEDNQLPKIENGVQVIKTTADIFGYSPKTIYIEKNKPIKWIIEGETLTSCNNEIIIPSLGQRIKLKEGENIINLDNTDETIKYSCWMGMLSGTIKVVDNLNNISPSEKESNDKSFTPSCCSSSNMNGLNENENISSNLIRKAEKNINTQSLSISTSDDVLNPYIMVIEKDIPLELTFNMDNLKNNNSSINFINSANSTTLLTIDYIKNNKATLVSEDLGEILIKNNSELLGIIIVVDNLENTDLNKILSLYLLE
ncbi:urease accessory protein UreH domain-containing protein [Clostridium sp. Marseille-Q7071]